MALTVTAPTRAYSIGPVKQAEYVYTAVSGDTSGTFTVGLLSQIDQVIVTGGMRLSAAPTISGTSVTLAFVDPSTAGYFGVIEIHGK